MTDNSPQSADTAAAAQRIRDLTQQIEQYAAQRQRRQWLTAIVGAVLAIVVIVSLARLTSMANKLDADAIAEITRGHVEQRLPDARASMQEYLEQEAPNIVAQALQSMLAGIPQVRALLVEGVMQKFEELNFEFEKRTMDVMAQTVQDSKDQIDRAYPQLSDREKLEKLVQVVAGQFTTVMRESTLELHKSYSAEMNRIISHLEDLQHRSPEQLTREQKLHKEIIETLLQLIAREQQTTTASPNR